MQSLVPNELSWLPLTLLAAIACTVATCIYEKLIKTSVCLYSMRRAAVQKERIWRCVGTVKIKNEDLVKGKTSEDCSGHG